MAAITLKDLHKTYGAGPKAVPVIHGVNADIADGEFIVIVGPSGCGKSTLLRMVAGLEDITGGEIAIGGRVVNQLEPAERDIAMVFQNYALYPHMSVYENMAYGLKIAKTPKAEIEARVQKAAKILELTQLLERKPRQLSGGQRQRVAMGRAIVRQPKAYLFDEPLSNLDAKLRAQTRIEIRKLHQELGVTSLFVTHDQVEAMTLGQRLMVMNAGRIEQMGTPEEVYARPASTFVASFIGSPPMNLLRGRVQGQHFLVDSGEAGLAPTALPLPGPAPREGEALLGVRPEHLELVALGPLNQLGDQAAMPAAAGADGQARSPRTAWPCIVQLSEMLGAERLVYGRIGGANLTVRLDAAAHAAPAPQQVLQLQVAGQHLHWFDAKTGQRL